MRVKACIPLVIMVVGLSLWMAIMIIQKHEGGIGKITGFLFFSICSMTAIMYLATLDADDQNDRAQLTELKKLLGETADKPSDNNEVYPPGFRFAVLQQINGVK